MNKTVYLVSPNFNDVFPENFEIGKFPDGDNHLRIPNLADCAGADVIIFHRLYPKQNTMLVNLLLILDAVKKQGAKSISVVVPYLPYSRQDKQKLEGEIMAARGLCRVLKAGGLNKLITFDCHFLNETGLLEFEGLPIQNFSMGPELVAKAKTIFNNEEFEIIGPDEGSRYLVEGHGGKSLKKIRKEYVGSRVTYRDVHEVAGELNVSGKNVLILDDMISSGNTMVKCLEKVAAAGAKKIVCAATHGLFLFDCADRMKVFTPNIFATDTIIGPYGTVSIKNKIQEI